MAETWLLSGNIWLRNGNPNRRDPGPPSWGLGIRLISLSRKISDIEKLDGYEAGWIYRRQNDRKKLNNEKVMKQTLNHKLIKEEGRKINIEME